MSTKDCQRALSNWHSSIRSRGASSRVRRSFSRETQVVAAHRAGKLQFFGNHTSFTQGKAFSAFLAPLRNSKWVVYCKRPFGGPKQVLRYLTRYTHRVYIHPRLGQQTRCLLPPRKPIAPQLPRAADVQNWREACRSSASLIKCIQPEDFDLPLTDFVPESCVGLNDRLTN